MISFALKNWKWLGGGVLVFVLVIAFIAWQDHKITGLERELVSSRASVASYQKGLAELQADTAAKIEALEIENRQSIARAKTLERLLGNIEGISDEENGPCASVLCGTIDRLYGKSTDSN